MTSNIFLYLHRLLYLFLHYIILFIIPIYIYKITGISSYLGIVFTIEWGVRLLSLSIVPTFFTFKNNIRIMQRTNIIQGLSTLLLLLCYITTNNIIFLIIIGVISSIFFDINYLSIENYIQNNIGTNQLLKIQSNIQAIEQTSMILSPFLAGMLIDHINSTHLISALGVCLTLIPIFLLFQQENQINVLTPPNKINYSIHEVNQTITKGIKIIASVPEALNLIILTNSINLIYGATLALLPAIILGHYNQSATFLGNFNFVISIISVISILVFNRLITLSQYKSNSIMYILLLITSISVLCGILQYNLNELKYTLILLGIIILADSIFSIGLRTKRQLIFNNEQFKVVLPCMMLLNAIAFPLGGIFVSLFTIQFNEPTTLLLISICTILLSVSLYIIKLTFERKK